MYCVRVKEPKEIKIRFNKNNDIQFTFIFTFYNNDKHVLVSTYHELCQLHKLLKKNKDIVNLFDNNKLPLFPSLNTFKIIKN